MSSPLDKLPPEVRRALIEGRAFDAIKLLRHHSGISLKSAQQRIEALKGHAAAAPPPPAPSAAHATPLQHPHHPPSNPEPLYREGLAPGEVPRSRESLLTWALIALALAAFARWRGWF